MARLPQPGGDSGTWGDILNDYLSQTLKPDGSLKDGSVTASALAPNSVTNSAIASDAVNATSIADGSITNAQLADGTIQEAKLSSSVQTKLNSSGPVPDANSTTKGILKLAGDLGGTADSPTVPSLSAKEPTILAGTTGQYWRGDKSWQTLDKTAVGLTNVDNTSDTTKNAASAALTNKDLTSGTNTFPTFNQSTTGNAATATKLQTARTINGVAFDGTANIIADSKFELYQDFTAAPNGALTVADSGQTWSLSYAATSASSPTISSGRYVNTFTGSGSSASYLTAQLSGAISFMEADLDFLGAGSTTGENCTLVAWVTQPIVPMTVIPDTPAHVVFTPTGYTYWTGTGGSLTPISTHTYMTPIAAGATQHVEVMLDKANSVAYVLGADNIVTSWPHSRIGTMSPQFACAEVYYTAADTDNRAEFQRFAASSKQVRDFDQHATRARALMSRGQALTPWRSAVGTTTTSTTTVSTSAFVNTAIPGLTTPTFTAPPSGTVTARYSCYLNVTTACLVFLAASYTGTTTSVITDYIADTNIPAGTRRVHIEQVITGLTPGGNYTVTGNVMVGTASAAQIQIDANKAAYLVVEPVY